MWRFGDRKSWAYGLLLVVAGLLAYSNVFQNQFLLDDEFLLQKNTLLSSWSSFFKIFTLSSTGGSGAVDAFYRPLQILCYLVFDQLFGFSPETFHSLNLLLHLGNAVLIFHLARKLGVSSVAALAGALLWMLHPLHTEAVTYMSATADPLHTFFFLLALLVLAPEFEKRRVWLAAFLFALALLSKESAIVLPAVVGVMIYSKVEKIWRWQNYLPTWPLWGVALVYLILRQTVLNFTNDFHFFKVANIYTESFFVRLLTFLSTIPAYFRLILWPEDLHLERSFPVSTTWGAMNLLGLVILLAALIFVVAERKRAPRLLSLGILWFLAVHIPQSGLLIPVNSFFLEHWMYLASVGPVLSLSAFADQKLNDPFVRRLAAMVVAAVALLWGTLTWRQNMRWDGPIVFYEYVLKVEPKPPARLYNNLAMAYGSAGRLQEAEANYRKAIEISDHYPQTHHNLGLLLLRENKIDEALQHFQIAVDLDPDFYHSLLVLEQIYQSLGQTQKAKEYHERYERAWAKFSH